MPKSKHRKKAKVAARPARTDELWSFFGGQGGGKATTPSWPLNEDVVRFCKNISNEAPILLPYTDQQAGYMAGNCHINVFHMIKQYGGSIVFGWIVWAGGPPKLEGEFHAVYQSPDGQLIDVTPRVDRESHIVFLSDPSRKPKPQDQILVVYTNRHMPGSIHKLMQPDKRSVIPDQRTLDLCDRLGITWSEYLQSFERRNR